jgi:ABC-2 type transport system ATP-binding protein
MNNVLSVKGLCKSYDQFTLDRISFEVPEGCVVGFIGSNGAGKTTTIQSIMGLTGPDGGAVEMFGKAIDPKNVPPQVKERIGVVFDTIAFPADCLIAEVARLGKASFENWDDSLFSLRLRDFDLDPKKKVKDLSRGMGMKLQMAFALAHRPELLILDEATAGLDPIARGEVLDILRDFMNDESHGILLSSHITSDLEKIADYVVCINDGNMVFSKPMDEVCDIAGIATCRAAEADKIIDCGIFEPGSMRVMRGGYSTEVLVPDRVALANAFPAIECSRANLEDYMRLTLKGEVR